MGPPWIMWTGQHVLIANFQDVGRKKDCIKAQGKNGWWTQNTVRSIQSLSLESSHFIIFHAGLKLKVTKFSSTITGKYRAVAFIWMVTLNDSTLWLKRLGHLLRHNEQHHKKVHCSNVKDNNFELSSTHWGPTKFRVKRIRVRGFHIWAEGQSVADVDVNREMTGRLRMNKTGVNQSMRRKRMLLSKETEVLHRLRGEAMKVNLL